jgi:hypothetical protein
MRRKITHETWEQIKMVYAAGINLREIARKMNIPEGTVLAQGSGCNEGAGRYAIRCNHAIAISAALVGNHIGRTKRADKTGAQ